MQRQQLTLMDSMVPFLLWLLQSTPCLRPNPNYIQAPIHNDSNPGGGKLPGLESAYFSAPMLLAPKVIGSSQLAVVLSFRNVLHLIRRSPRFSHVVRR
ncbi:hypothetical protein PYCCODRAFT_1152580 [Trametes coccinea BRFM310]|uniref:Secreted protein n=1 Tax=Trametes coccinea (strain BRFM310) TaxID=1353009 RepID=A0A1Y2J015_TRAC3|nr:hypothetical protein PYCCODRAFT_1152580 [Trametes coccinea BRFM310]